MEATHHFNESLALWRETGDARTAPAALAGLGCVAVAEGRLDEAREVLAHALDIGYKVGSRVDLVESLDGCAILAAAENRLEQAISLMCTATEHRAAMEHPMSPAEQEFLERWLLPARRILGEDATAEACSTGAASSI